MEKLIGKIATAPVVADGRVTFMLLDDRTGKMVSCMSESELDVVPVIGSQVVLNGEQKADLILGVTPYFVFSQIEELATLE